MTFATATACLPEGTVTSSNADLRGLLKALFTGLDGIESIRVLASDDRYWAAHDKVYFVLATHDIDRDEQIVKLMCQLASSRVDYDLVPLVSVGMVPRGAVAI